MLFVGVDGDDVDGDDGVVGVPPPNGGELRRGLRPPTALATLDKLGGGFAPP